MAMMGKQLGQNGTLSSLELVLVLGEARMFKAVSFRWDPRVEKLMEMWDEKAVM